MSTLNPAENASLIINWGPNCENPPSHIAFYRVDPAVSNVTPEIIYRTYGQSSGRITTEVKFGKHRFPDGWNRYDQKEAVDGMRQKRNSNLCLPFYIASLVQSNIETINCLKIQPNWMSQRIHLNEVPFNQLFLPGTHASGCYINPNGERSAVQDYFVKQNFDVWSQLIFGARYLDIGKLM